MGTNVYQDVPDFLFFGHKDLLDFLKFHWKLNFFFYYPFYFKILFWGAFHLGALGNGLIGLVEGPALLLIFIAIGVKDKKVNNVSRIWKLRVVFFVGNQTINN